MILLPPKRVSFEWFEDLIRDKNDKWYAFLAYFAIHETSAAVITKNQRIFVEHPKVYVIDKGDPIYDIILDNFSYSVFDFRSDIYKKVDDPHETEFAYVPDTLGFYLPENKDIEGVLLESGIYILVPKILRYSDLLQRTFKVYLSPNILLSFVFYHEYMHLLLDVAGIGNNNHVTNFNAMYKDLEEAICEGLAYSTLHRRGTKLFTEFLDTEHLIEEKCHKNLDIILPDAELIILTVTQLLYGETFLNLPRIYPYKLVKHFFVEGEIVGWNLINVFLNILLNKPLEMPGLEQYLPSKERDEIAQRILSSSVLRRLPFDSSTDNEKVARINNLNALVGESYHIDLGDFEKITPKVYLIIQDSRKSIYTGAVGLEYKYEIDGKLVIY